MMMNQQHGKDAAVTMTAKVDTTVGISFLSEPICVF